MMTVTVEFMQRSFNNNKMTDQTFFSVDILLENPKPIFIECTDLLLRFANNILKDPKNEKYRRVRVANPLVQNKLLPVAGSIECMFEMGFEEDGEYFTLPPGACLDTLQRMRDTLQSHRHSMVSEGGSQPAPSQAATSTSQPVPTGSLSLPPPASSPRQSTRPPPATNAWPQNFLASEAAFFQKVKSCFDHVVIYENRDLQDKARRLIPVKDLEERATKRQSEWAESNTAPPPDQVNKTPPPGVQDFMLLELLSWFKHDFFKWLDKPECEHCGGVTTSAGAATPTAQDLAYGGHRVEDYVCNTCCQHTRFTRYNHPGKLLETRRGRCGEWANCFCLCCRALGFEVRHVVSWSDHVWAEIFSASQNCWVHCDPCEDVCDKPLLYEAGWGSKLSYILAFSVDDIQDVTWRYSSKHQEVLSNRTQCREPWLVNLILKLRKQRQQKLSATRKKVLENRLIVELCQFMMDKSASSEELQGRKSGSLDWRSSRGETGPAVESTTITPTGQEVENRCIHLRYNTARDVYVRGTDEIRGWHKMVSAASDVMRKEERDWKMVYLCRTEGSDKGRITWTVDLTDSGLVIDRVELVSLTTSCYEDGQVRWSLVSGPLASTIDAGSLPMTVTSCSGHSQLSLTADMRRGQGDVAWQHTQLFRQPSSDDSSWPLEIKLHLRPK